MSTLNLGILAHVDAGKTSLTERLLHAAGVIDHLGRVDDGSTQTDSLALERQRGITIKAAVVSFAVADVTVNLIDTPGHPDFIAEVERVLGVLDGVVLVVSAVEGVQAQTRVLMRTLRRLGIPALIFINKVDRSGAQGGPLLESLAERLHVDVLAMNDVRHLGTRAAEVTPYGRRDPSFVARLAELVADHDDAFLGRYLDDQTAPYEALRADLVELTRRVQVHPVFFGSAITGAGVAELVTALTELLPTSTGDPHAPPAGTVFKIERGPVGDKIAYVHVGAGTLRVRDRIPFGRAGQPDHNGRITAIGVFD